MARMRTLLVAVPLLAGSLACFSVSAQEAPAPAEDKKTAAVTGQVPERELAARIDREIEKVWQRDGIAPAKASDDEEFCRRVYLDTVGVPPMPEELAAFLASKDESKREHLVSTLVADPRFGEHLADVWSTILLGRGGGGGADRGQNATLFAIWMARRINAGARFSDIIYDIVTAKGSLSTNPAVAVYTRERPFKVANAAGLVSKTLTGQQIQCAECHDHPYEEAWTEEVFTGVASFFAPVNQQINVRRMPVDPRIDDKARRLNLPKEAGEKLPPEAVARMAEQERYSRPVTIDGRKVLTEDREFWRPYLAKWMISRDNKQTPRYIANRFWSFAFGMGLLNPVDDFNSFNEASHPELLELLAGDLVASGYDIKRLYRALLNSRTYQLSSRNRPEKAQPWHFAGSTVRQLSPEQFFGSLVNVAGGSDLARAFRGKLNPGAQMRKVVENRMKQAEKGGENEREVTFDEEALKRFEALYAGMGDTWFLRRTLAGNYAALSSDDEMTETDGFTLSIDQALAVMNGEVTNRISGSGRGTVVAEVLARLKSDEDRLEALFLRVLCRKPDAGEKALHLGHVRKLNGDEAAWEDVFFALLAGTEFATNH